MASPNEYQKWVNSKEEEFASKLANGQYNHLYASGHIPAQYFNHRKVKVRLRQMMENDTMDPENKRRIPVLENYPHFRPDKMKEYLQSFANGFKIEPERYEIYIQPSQPNNVFYRTLHPPMTIKGAFKIHLMFNIKYLFDVLIILFQRLIQPNTMPVMFKLLNYNRITAIPGQAGIPTPQINNAHAHQYDYGANYTKKQKYSRMAESFMYTPTEIKKYPVSFKDTSTFKLNATTIKKKINEEYDFETLFDPVMVFYTENTDYTKALLGKFLEIFPDEVTREWVLPNYYPRANIKINNMIYIGNGDFYGKYGNTRCKPSGKTPNGKIEVTCMLDPSERLSDIPTEYEEIQSNCSKRAADECDAANRFPLAVSNNKLCKLEKGQCKPAKTYSQHLILDGFDSIEDLYKELGQSAVFERFKAGNANGSLPANYGGRRKTRNKRKNKSRRAH